jgi:hypothetical protein
MHHFYRDRLGTNIGKALLKKSGCVPLGALNADRGLRLLIDRFMVYHRDRETWGTYITLLTNRLAARLRQQ